MSINPELLLHQSDKAALRALKAIPGFQQLVKTYMGIMNERQMRIINKSSNLQLSEKQMPEYYNMLPPICEKLGIPVPELYLELDVVPNAYTYGDTEPFIVLTTGMLETVPDYLIPTVLAHECGHIACHHTLYRTMGRLLLNGAGRFMTGLASLLTVPIEVAFAYWMRCSEFSADRAAVICDGTPDKMAEVCFRLAGYDKDIHAQTSMDAFIEQAEEYKALIAGDKWNQTLEFVLLSGEDHPLTAVRALECREWAASEQYGKVLSLLQHRMLNATNAACDIPAPESSKECVRKDKDDLLIAFEKEGFRNIELVRSFEKGSASKPGQIVSALINGEESFDKGEWISSDSHLIFTYYEPKSDEEIAAEHPNEILLPQNASAYIGKEYSTVIADFTSLGFADVSAEPLLIKRSVFVKEGSTAKVSLDGDSKFKQGQWVAKNSHVCIIFNKFEDQQPSQQSEAKTIGDTASGAVDAVNNFVGNLFKPKSNN